MDDLKKKFDEFYKDRQSKEGRMLFVMGTQKMIEKFNTDFNNDMKIVMAKNIKEKQATTSIKIGTLKDKNSIKSHLSRAAKKIK